MAETDRAPMTFEEWLGWYDHNEGLVTLHDLPEPEDQWKVAFEAGRAAGIEEAAANCDHISEQIVKEFPEADEVIKVSGEILSGVSKEIRALLPDREKKP